MSGVEGFQRVNHIACRDPEIMLSLCDARQYQAVLENSHSGGSISKNQIPSMEMLHIQENPCVLDNVGLLCVAYVGVTDFQSVVQGPLGALNRDPGTPQNSETYFNFPF